MLNVIVTRGMATKFMSLFNISRLCDSSNHCNSFTKKCCNDKALVKDLKCMNKSMYTSVRRKPHIDLLTKRIVEAIYNYIYNDIIRGDKHSSKFMDKQTIIYMNAVYSNYSIYFKSTINMIHPYAENLDDKAYKYDTCTICDYVGENTFYYSTTFGLNMPVCIECVGPESGPESGPDYEVATIKTQRNLEKNMKSISDQPEPVTEPEPPVTEQERSNMLAFRQDMMYVKYLLEEHVRCKKEHLESYVNVHLKERMENSVERIEKITVSINEIIEDVDKNIVYYNTILDRNVKKLEDIKNTPYNYYMK